MAALLSYLLQTSLGLLLCHGLYRLCFRRLTFHRGNRFLLIAGLVASFLLPLPSLPATWLAGIEAETGFAVWKNDLLTAPLEGKTGLQNTASPLLPGLAAAPAPSHASSSLLGQVLARDWTWLWTLLTAAWPIGAFVGLGRLAASLLLLRRMRRRGKVCKAGGRRIVELPGKGQAFSFFGTIYLSASYRGAARQMILDHEAAHARQWHSLDRMLFQIAGALLWFHPLMPAYRRFLVECHEYLADQSAAARAGALPYARLLLGLAQQAASPDPVNCFAASSTRNRIQMLNQSPSPLRSRMRYLLVLPLLPAMALLFAVAKAPEPLPPVRAALESTLAEPLLFAGEPVPVHLPEVRKALETAVRKITAQPSRLQHLEDLEAKWRPQLDRHLLSAGVPTDFFYMAVAESQLQPRAKSPGGAGGMWQFMPQTARGQGLRVDDKVDERMDVELSSAAAAGLLVKLKDKLGSWTLAASAYNRGAHAVERDVKAGKVQEPADLYKNPNSSRYLLRILAFKLAMEHPELAALSLEEVEALAPTGPLACPLPAGTWVVSSPYGQREGSPFHKGIDLAAAPGTQVSAPMAGKVVFAGDKEKHGLHIVLDHGGGWETRYSHLSKLSVVEGQAVDAGALIGEVGSTGLSNGPHLHYEIHENGEAIDPADRLR